MKSLFSGVCITGLLLVSGCAHNYFYTPEVSGAGAMSRKGGVIYSVPPSQPEVKIKVMSNGVIKKPEDLPADIRAKMDRHERMVEVRLFFVRMPGVNSSSDFVIPSEQHVLLRDTDEIGATFARATVSKTSRIELTSKNRKQGIALFFPLPDAVQDDNELQFFKFKWTLHYGDGKTEQQTLRFDRQDSAPHGGGGGVTQEDEGIFGEWGGEGGFAPGADGGLYSGPYWLL
jgi:hypothetical protein